MKNDAKGKSSLRTLKALNESFLEEQYDQNVLYKAFIAPFTDVAKVAQHGIKKTAAKGFGNLGLAVTHALSTLLPFKDFSEIIQKRKEKLANDVKNIDQEFAQVLATSKVWQDPDFLGFTFLMNPAAWIGANLALRAPGPTMDMISTLLGGNETIDRWRGAFHQATTPRRVYAGAGSAPAASNLGSGDVSYDDAAGAMGIDEQAQPQAQQQYAQAVAQWLQNPQNQAAINNSPIAQKLKLLPLNLVKDEAQRVLGFKSFEQLMAKNPEAANQILQDVGASKEQIKNPEVKQKLDQAASALEKKIKSIFSSNLQGIKSLNPNSAKTIDAVAAQINKM